MNRLVSLLLIPLFILGQVCCHSHAETGVDAPSNHDSRPHVHVSVSVHHHGHSHHEHSDDKHQGSVAADLELTDMPGAVFSVNEHDSDAIYLSNSPITCRQSFGGWEIDSSLACVIGAVCLKQGQTYQRQRVVPPQRYWTLPIYLLTASLLL